MPTAAVLTLTQALQLVGLAPCLFLVALLAALSFRNVQAIVPGCYFLALSCSFALPLVDLFVPGEYARELNAGLLFGESMLAAFSFLLIMQFLSGRVPPGVYWLVLALPLIGGGQLIYVTTLPASELCQSGQSCVDVGAIKTLYNVFASAMVFLLLIYYASRISGLEAGDAHKGHKYWLIIVLILSHVLVLAVDLARLSGHMSSDDAFFTETVLRLMFIYLVITSLFRVFYPAMVQQAVPFAENRRYDPAQDAAHVAAVTRLLEQEHAYREMRLNRAALAQKVGVGEHHLSRIINHAFGKNFNELVNTYRIEDAKRRLKSEDTQITVIAFEVGFNSIASFNRVFKEKVGVSPTEFREKV